MAFEEAAGGPGPYFAPSAPARLPGGNPFLPIPMFVLPALPDL